MLRAIALFLIATAAVASAKVVELELTLGYTRVNFSGRDAEAMAVNGSIPAPTLRFTEGDTARIVVRNTMREETSIHWHGLLVPNAMDGVPHVNMPPIPPGGSFTYEFRLRQTGTYWYHSHTVLQEQRGVYGGIVVLPRGAKARAGRDVVAVLSDWTDEAPGEVLRTLRRGSDWYSLRKGTAQSIVGAAQHGALGAYFQREWMRMPPMDFSDVAYDKFLLNGAPERTLDARPGETVRLRIINAAASTYFHLGWAGGPLRVIAADGQDVEPVNISRFLIAIAETYDVLLTVPRDGAYEFRATSQDGTGHTSLFIGQGPRHAAPDVPKPNVYLGMGAMKMSGGDMGGMPGMKMSLAVTTPTLSPVAQSPMDAMPGMKMPAATTKRALSPPAQSAIDRKSVV